MNLEWNHPTVHVGVGLNYLSFVRFTIHTLVSKGLILCSQIVYFL